MSAWNAYIDNVIAHSNGSVDKACIIGKNGALWTDHSHAAALKLSQEEAMAIGLAYEDPAKLTALQGNGVVAENKKYRFLRSDEDMIAAKLKEEGALVCMASATAVVIVHVKEGIRESNGAIAAAKITEYLRSVNM